MLSLSNLIAKGYSRQSTSNQMAGITPLKTVVVKNNPPSL